MTTSKKGKSQEKRQKSKKPEGAFHDKSTNQKPFLHPYNSDFDENWSIGLSTALNTPVTFSGLSESWFSSYKLRNFHI